MIATGWFLSTGAKLIYPAILPQLRDAFAFQFTTAGMLLSVLWVTYAIGQFPGGIIADRFGDGRVLAASIGLTAGTIAIVAVASTARVLFVTTAMLGLATALYGPTRHTILSNVYPDRLGTTIGITQAAGSVGHAVIPAVAVAVATASTWRVGLGMVALPTALVAIAISVFVPARTTSEGEASSEQSHTSLRGIIAAVSRRSVLLATSILLLVTFVWQGFTGFYPTYLVEVKGLDASLAALLFGLFFAAGVVFQLLIGEAADRLGSRRTLLATGPIVVLALGALPFVTSLPMLIVVTVLSSSLLGLPPVTNAYLVARLPADTQGSSLGLVRTIYLFFAAAAPTVVGAFADQDLFSGAFLFLAGVAIAVLVVAALLPE